MPRNMFQRMIFALLTVVITVHAYVFYSLYVINWNTLMEVNQASSVLNAIKAQSGVMMMGNMCPIWMVVLVEFCLAFLLENIYGSPLSFKLACRVFDPRKNHPMIFESAIICATVELMCPVMSLLAAIIYYPYYMGFHVLTLLANWLNWYALIFRLHSLHSYSLFSHWFEHCLSLFSVRISRQGNRWPKRKKK